MIYYKPTHTHTCTYTYKVIFNIIADQIIRQSVYWFNKMIMFENFPQHQKEMELEEKVREMDINGYHQYNSSHMPFAFRVQPNQPNLQERI